MKRPVGITVWAVLLVLSGLLSGLLAFASLSAGPQALDRLRVSLSNLEQLPTGAGEERMTPEQATELRRRGEALVQELGAVMESPQARGGVWLGLILAVAALSAGIGLFLLQAWGARLAVWQALLAIQLGLFAMISSPQRRIMSAMLEFYEGMGNAEAFSELQRMMQAGQTIGEWAGILWLLAWNGLVIWYFNRTSVKAIFTPGHV